MKLKSYYFIGILLLSITVKLTAQTETVATGHPVNNTSGSIQNHKQQPNFFKVNLTAILLKNYSIQYERILSRKFSIALSYRVMPTTTLPFQSYILKSVGNDDPETEKTIQNFKLSNYAITPEVRFYVNLDIFYTDSAGAESSAKLSGKLTGNSGGILFGVQRFFEKHIVLDT